MVSRPVFRRRVLCRDGDEDYTLGSPEPVTLLLPGEVTDHPGDRVHRVDPFRPFLFADLAETALELGPGEAELVDEGIGHGGLALQVGAIGFPPSRISTSSTEVACFPTDPVQGFATLGGVRWKIGRPFGIEV